MRKTKHLRHVDVHAVEAEAVGAARLEFADAGSVVLFASLSASFPLLVLLEWPPKNRDLPRKCVFDHEIAQNRD